MIQCERIVPEFSGGVEHFAVGLLNGFGSVARECDRFDVTIARGTRARWSDHMQDGSPLELVEVVATASLAHSTVWMWRVPALRGLRTWLARGALSRRVLNRLRVRVEARILADRQPDIVYSPFHRCDGEAPRSVITVHDLRELQPQLQDASMAAILARNIARASAIVTSWPHPYSQLRDLGPSVARKLFLVPFPIMNGPTFEDEVVVEVSDRPVLLYPAATSEHKNHVRLVEALARVLEQRNVLLVCTGTKVAPGYERAIRAARHHGIEDAICFKGHVPREQLESLYRRAATIVVPSLWEAASGPIFEAFAYAKPIACSDIPPIRSQVESCGGTARFFDPLQPAQIAEAILEVLDHPEPYVASAPRAAAYMRQFSWEKTAEDYLSIFEWVRVGSPPEARPSLSFDPRPSNTEPRRASLAPD